MEKYRDGDNYSQYLEEFDKPDALENRTRRRSLFARTAPVILGLASLWGGEHLAVAQTDKLDRGPEKVEVSREFSNSHFGLDEITRVGNGVLLGTFSKERGEMAKKHLVAKYGESAVEFGFQFEREEIEIANASEGKIALQNSTDEMSIERIAALDAKTSLLESRHVIEELALESLLKKPAIENSIGTQHFAVRVENKGGSPFILGGKNSTRTDQTVQVSYVKSLTLTGESEVAIKQTMERLLSEYLKQQGLDIRNSRVHYNFEYLVRDPASYSDRPVYLLVEGFIHENPR